MIDSENCLCTAPDSAILKGITRKYVLHLAEKLGIPIQKREIKRSELNNFSAAFICGTSPKILPVKEIDQHKFSISNRVVEQLIEAYNGLISDCIISADEAPV